VDAGRAAAIARSYLASQRYDVIFIDADMLDAALDRMAKLADKRLSLADCASFETIERLGLDGAFTFDADFHDCGYVSMPF
jgi:predicted nucleic acid-binding protein